MKLAQQGQIELDLEDIATMHTIAIMFGSFDLKTRKPRPQAIKPKVEQGRKHHCRNNRNPKTKSGTREYHCRNNKKPKKNIRAAKPMYAREPMEQKPRNLVSLHEYFLKDFFQ
ncbi:hypothetical protein PS2_040420 [Malus domestica]